MSNSSVREQKSDSSRIQELYLDNEIDFINSLKPIATESAGGLESGGGAPGDSGNQNDPTGNYLPTEGGTMIGPIAFFPRLVDISNDEVDVSKNAGNFTGKLIISAESGITDNLQTIKGAEHAGQKLTLQAIAGETITINALGNIIPPNGVSFDLVGAATFGRSIELQYDSVSGKWLFVDAAIWKDLFDSISAGGSDNLGDHNATQDLHMNNNDILSVANIDLDGIAATIEGVVNLQFYNTANSINSIAGKLLFQVDSSEEHRFAVGGATIIEIGSNGIDLFNHDLDNVNDIHMNSGIDINDDTTLGSLTILLDSTDELRIFRGVPEIANFGAIIEFYNSLFMDDNNIQDLGSVHWFDGGNITHNGMVTSNNPYEIFHHLGKVLEYDDEFGAKVLKMDSTARIDFNNTVSSATAGTRTLPANPGGFIQVRVGGANVKIPYYF